MLLTSDTNQYISRVTGGWGDREEGLYMFEADCWTEVYLPPVYPGLDEDGNHVHLSFLV